MSSGPPPSPPHKRDRIPQSTRESAAHRARCSSSFLLLSLGGGFTPPSWLDSASQRRGFPAAFPQFHRRKRKLPVTLRKKGRNVPATANVRAIFITRKNKFEETQPPCHNPRPRFSSERLLFFRMRSRST